MPTRIILLPLTEKVERGATGDRILRHTPDTLGVQVQDAVIRSDYRDVGKVRVTAPQAKLDELAEKSRALFQKLWKPPQRDQDG